MKQIWKFNFDEPRTRIQMPVGAEILDVQTQDGTPRMWAIVDPDKEKETRVFDVIGTGHDINDEKRKYIGTFQVENGLYVFHVFEVIQ